jgi:H2-forming N5,N10-methylenetetrahydromethanopterin dehydrogenase-like enzyme
MRLRFPRLRKKQEAAQPSVNVQQHGRAIDNTSTDTASAIGSRHQPASVLATSQSSEAHNVLPSKAGSAAVSLPTELNSTAADTGERHGKNGHERHLTRHFGN